MGFYFFALPLECTIVEFDVSHLKFFVVEIATFHIFLLVTEEVVDSVQTGLRIHEVDDGHDDQSHRNRDEVEDREDSEYFG